MARLDRSEGTHLEASPIWRGLVRFCLGVLSLGVTIFLGIEVYACSIFRAFGDNAKVLGLKMPYSIMMPLLGGLCLIFAFVAVYALFFPTPSSTEN